MSYTDSFPAIRVVLADDHPLIREAIRNRLAEEEDIEIVGEARNGHDALRLVQTRKPRVLVLDMQMPGMSGVEVAEALHAADSPVRVLVLSAYDNREYVLKLLREFHVPAYLTKDEPVDRIVDVIRSIARGESGFVSPDAAKKLIDPVDPSTDDEGLEKLSRREREVLLLLTEGKKNAEIAEALFIAPNTVKKHLNNIYYKIEVNGRAEAVNWAWEKRLKTRDEDG